ESAAALLPMPTHPNRLMKGNYETCDKSQNRARIPELVLKIAFLPPNQYARSYRPPAAKQEERLAAPLAGRLGTPYALKLRQQRRADGNRRHRLDPAGLESRFVSIKGWRHGSRY